MGREIDERWIEEAIERYRHIEELQAKFDQALATVEVCVRSPDGLVELVITADGSIREVMINDLAQSRPVRELSRAVHAAVTAAAEAARWARAKVYQEAFGEYGELASRTGWQGGELASRTGWQGGELASRTGLPGGAPHQGIEPSDDRRGQP